MANFLKPSDADPRGYDAGINKQTVDVGEASDVALWGGGDGGERLQVALNDPSVAEVTEGAPDGVDLRRFTAKGLKLGNAMLEAKDGQGHVWAFMQIEVATPPPLTAPTVYASPHNAGRTQTTVETALRAEPFPSVYATPYAPDPSLQSALDRAMAANAGNTALAVAVVALNPDGSRPVAHVRGDEVHYSASLIKIAAMYSAFELRRAMRDLAEELGDRTSPASFFKQAAAHFDPKIMAKVATIPALARVSKGHAVPRYTTTFDLVKQGSVPGYLVNFSSKFANHLNLMISISDNDSAGACVHGSGYGYLNGTLASAGFFDPGANRGIWLAGDYKDLHSPDKYPAIRIGCVNDGTTAQGATALQLVRMLTLLNDRTLVGALSSQEMLDLLATTLGTGEIFSTRADGLNFTAVCGKIGLGPLQTGKQVLSEASILEHTSGRRFAVGWQNLLQGDGLGPISFTLRDTFAGYLGV